MDDKYFLCPVCKCAPLITGYCPSCSRIEGSAPSSDEVAQMVEMLRSMDTYGYESQLAYAAADALESLEQQVAVLTKERDDYRTGYYAQNETRAKFQQELNACEEHLAAAQAREAKLRDAALDLPPIVRGRDLNEALTLSTDDSALTERLNGERERVYVEMFNQGYINKQALQQLQGA